MIDTHCHLTYDGLIERVDAVLAGAAEAGVDRMITVGTTPDDAARALTLAQREPRVFATAGLHPHYAPGWRDRTVVEESLRRFAAEPRVVALGEMGLDRHYPDPPMAMQRAVLGWQLATAGELARESLNAGRTPLPIIIHNREATAETLAMLRDSGVPAERFVFHCFTGEDAELDAILDFGAMVSFTGIITFKNAAKLAASAARTPLDRLMIETDSPYLTPEPHRRVKINEPRHVADVARFLAAKRGMDVAAFVQAVDANAVRFFGLA